MKEWIVIMGMILLACVLFGSIAGDGQSLRGAEVRALQKIVRSYEEPTEPVSLQARLLPAAEALL